MPEKIKALYIFIFGFVLGVLWRSFFDFGFAFPTFLLALAAGLVLAFFVVRYRLLLLVALFCIAGGLGVVRFDIADTSPHPLLLKSIGTEITAEGVIIDEPDERVDTTHLTVELFSVNNEAIDAKVLAYAETYPQFQYGDRVRFSGELGRPESFETETGRVFDYKTYLAKDDIHFTVFYPEIEKVGSGAGNPIKRGLFRVKHAFLETVHEVIPEPESSLLGGLVVGAKQALGEGLQDAFRATGIIHIVVLSGYNVTIVADAIMRALAFLPQIAGITAGGVAIVLFAIMTGASATIVRASIMAILVLLARATGRTYAILHALVVAGFGMILHNPFVLAFDPSFQLSFLATLGLIVLVPAIEKYFAWIPGKWGLRDVALATLSTQIFVLPLLLYMIGEISLVALPVNLLILLVVPITMLFGFLTGFIGFASTLLALPLAYATYGLLAYQLAVVDFFADLPFASATVPPFSFIFVILIYICYALGIWWLYKRYTKTLTT